MLFVTDIEAGLKFYRDKLGHELLWQRGKTAGLKMPASDAELVISEEIPQETCLLVDDAIHSYKFLVENGCKTLREPFDIPIGKLAIVLDPWGNELHFLDLSKRKN